MQDLHEYTSSLQDASLAYCDAYKPTRTSAFAGFTQDSSLHKQIVRAGEKLRRINVIAPFLPLLIAARLRFAEDARKYLDMVRLCEVFAFRVYRFSERRSAAGQSALFRMGHEIYCGEVDYESVLAEIRSWLLYYCPNDDFREGFKLNDDDNDWYECGGLKYFLYEYKEYLAKDDVVQLLWDVLERTDLQKSIEHILPQTPSDRYWTTRFNRKSQRRVTHDLTRRETIIAWALQRWHVDDDAAHFPDDEGELSLEEDEGGQ